MTAFSPGDLIRDLLVDLDAEREVLVSLLAGRSERIWDSETPAPGWSIRHQIAHLAFFDHAAALSIGAPDAFAGERRAADTDPEAYGSAVLEPYLAMTGPRLLESWASAGAQFAEVAAQAPPKLRAPWYGPSMTVPSMVTARIMETWAHGQDVADSLGASRPETPRLQHIARLACLARPNPYLVRGLEPPESSIRVELTTAGREKWTWGDTSADQTVRGGILDFCLVMTRRRHVDDTGLEATGADAEEWLRIGQAYAGDPGVGRSPVWV